MTREEISKLSDDQMYDLCTLINIQIEMYKSYATEIYKYYWLIYKKLKVNYKPELIVSINIDNEVQPRIISYKDLINVFIKHCNDDVIPGINDYKNSSISNALNIEVSNTLNNLYNFISDYERNIKFINKTWDI